ncbi:MAG: ribbon-helix-helix protein, CopG family [Acidobacteria bacterium]|nr:ribbon-helix-helix protein, CopG family [Acidobacteriota bacterium]
MSSIRYPRGLAFVGRAGTVADDQSTNEPLGCAASRELAFNMGGVGASLTSSEVNDIVWSRRCSRMVQVTARLPEDLVEKADRAASRLNRSRAQLLRQALEYYLEDFEDLRLALDRLNDPADPVLDWEDVRRDLLDQDQGERG